MVAAVGPCIGPQSYEVGLEFLHRFEADSPGSGRSSRPARPTTSGCSTCRPSSWTAWRRPAWTSEWVGRDTRTEPELFFSNRRAFLAGESDYGRLLSAIALEA